VGGRVLAYKSADAREKCMPIDNKPFVEKTGAPNVEQINREVAERLKFFEDKLRGRGLHLVCGAELEFFTLNEKRTPWKKILI